MRRVKVAVALFARYREAVGRDRVEVEVPEGATVDQVWAELARMHPVLDRYRPHTLFAIGNEYVGPDRPLAPGEELACFPPVSGGGGLGRAGPFAVSGRPDPCTA